ncbi:MAG TPA: sialate O-acetylesterase, partial [Pyrinomonadaceae bacterium]|nr:sialate O-acetylesterase [Pyrinomonadaceae bacterium]
RKAAELFLLAVCFFLLAAQARGAVRVPSLVGDNMVLQQGRAARVWGWAEPGERVTVRLAGRTATAATDASGRWEVFIGPLRAGGPHTLTIIGSNTLTFRNVLVGEVWVCSGQSNMEWPLAQAEGGPRDAEAANLPRVRLFTVEKRTSDRPLEDVRGRWVVATPEQAARFSAVGFYFGRALHARLGVPVGLIHTSWGGTPAEAWTSRAALEADPSFRPILERYEAELRDLPRRLREHEVAFARWEGQYVRLDSGNEGEGRGFADPARDADGWRKMRLPQLWEGAGLKVDGAVWFRREVNVPPTLAGRELILSLGAVDDFDTTYFNGVRVGATGAETPYAYQTPRRYRVPAPLVRPGRNVVAVRVFDRMGGGGFAAEPGAMSLAPADPKAGAGLSLEGEWDYKAESVAPEPAVDYAGYPGPRPGPDNPNNPTVLYNAMLAPLTPYAIRGAVWYQGESNAGRAYQYRALFPALIRDWRRAWGQPDFPFYFVQLANWRARKSEPAESDWAELREAQLFTLRSVPRTGMAVAVDIGEAEDIHPRNKRDVGERLARWALAETYKQRVVPSGPLYESHAVEGGRVRLRFGHASGLKTSDGASPKGFAVAGADRKFVWAEARVEGDTVVVWSERVPTPAAVRYAWADNPAVNLYNGAGLPASPFRTDDWPGLTAGRN